MVAGLLTTEGRRIPAADLAGEVAGPTIIGVRPAVSSIEVGGITPWRLAEMMFAADNGVSMAWQEMALEIERRDMHYLGVLGTRKRTVSQLPITIDPAGDDAEAAAHASYVEDWLRGDVLQARLFDMLDAIAKGFSVCEIMWRMEPGQIQPEELVFRPQRFFEVAWQDGETIKLRVDSGYADIEPLKFVVHKHPSFSGLTIQSGLTRVAAWAWMFKTFTMRDWSAFVQNYGAPVRLGRYGPDSSPEDREVLWQAVSNIAGDAAAIVPASMQVEFIQPGNTTAGAELYERRCNWLDSQVSKAVLGQTGTTDANPGSHAAGRTHRLVQEDIERADCRQLERTLNRQLIAPMVAFKFGPQPQYPVIRIGRPDETPITEVSTALQWMGPQGLTVKATEIRQRLNLSEPAENDEVIGGRMPTPAPLDPRPGGPDGAPELLPAEQRPPEAERPTASAPDDPPPPVSLHAQIGRLVELHVQQQGPMLIELMTANLGRRAAHALGGMTDAVRAQVEAADSLDDLRNRLDRLRLDPEAFAGAMQGAMAIAELAGQAGLLDEIKTKGSPP